MKEKYRKYEKALIWICVAIGLAFGSASISRSNQIAACERGNYLRAVVFDSVEAAAKANEGEPAEAEFQKQLDTLKATPYADPETGEINCDDAIKEIP